MLIGKQFTERLYSENQEERLYSTGNEMLDNLLERAFCEGYELAQREYAEEAEKGALVVIPSKQIVKRSGSKIADFLRNNKKALIIGTAGTALAGGGAYLLHRHNKKKKEEEDKRKKSN